MVEKMTLKDWVPDRVFQAEPNDQKYVHINALRNV